MLFLIENRIVLKIVDGCLRAQRLKTLYVGF